jgi:hypothetical protein
VVEIFPGVAYKPWFDFNSALRSEEVDFWRPSGTSASRRFGPVGEDAMKAVLEMAMPIEGSCLCGQVTYRCTKQSVWSVNCHCRACQKLSGAPYVSAFSVPADSFELFGETKWNFGAGRIQAMWLRPCIARPAGAAFTRNRRAQL